LGSNPYPDLLLPDEIAQSIAVNQVNGRGGCRRCPTGGFGEAPECDENGPFSASSGGIPLEEGDYVSADRCRGVVALRLNGNT
jgi:hypothetical protein